MPKFRCMVCNNAKGLPGRDFTAAEAVCPECGLDPRKNERDVGLIVTLETIHYDPPAHARRGKGHAACNPTLALGLAKYMTGEPASVTCDDCRATEEWRAGASARGIPTVAPESDVVVNAEAGKLDYETIPPNVG